jgi:hypothetical protein
MLELRGVFDTVGNAGSDGLITKGLPAKSAPIPST